MVVIYGNDLIDPKEEFNKDFLIKEEHHQITMDEYGLRITISDAFKNVITVVTEFTDSISEGLKKLASGCGMSMQDTVDSLEKALETITEYKELGIPSSKYLDNSYSSYKNKLQYTSVKIPKKRYHKARGCLR